MKIVRNQELVDFNTFGIACQSEYFVEIKSLTDLIDLSKQDIYKNQNKLILGGGSNILFTSNFQGLIIKNNITGVEITKETSDFVEVKIGAGVNWHEFVIYCVNKGWGGIENLSLIPGNCGTAPMQNIGAYGVEIKDTFINLEAFEINSGKIAHFNAEDCQFGYRESVFKNQFKNQYVILNISLRLNKNPAINTSYGDINRTLESKQISNPTIKDVSDAVIEIRQSKLPDPNKIGNSGSFFKNPIIPISQLTDLKKEFPEIVSYKIDDSQVKIAAGWLIEKAGWKGKTFNNYGVHKNQSLVLVNYGGAKGQDIFDLSQKILEDIAKKFQIKLEREVNII